MSEAKEALKPAYGIDEHRVTIGGIPYRRKTTSWRTVHDTTASHNTYYVRETVYLNPHYNRDIIQLIDEAIASEFGK